MYRPIVRATAQQDTSFKFFYSFQPLDPTSSSSSKQVQIEVVERWGGIKSIHGRRHFSHIGVVAHFSCDTQVMRHV